MPYLQSVLHHKCLSGLVNLIHWTSTKREQYGALVSSSFVAQTTWLCRLNPSCCHSLKWKASNKRELLSNCVWVILGQQVCVAEGWCICRRLVQGIGGSCRKGFPGFGRAAEEVIGCAGTRGHAWVCGGFGTNGVFLRGFLLTHLCSWGRYGRLFTVPERSPARRPTPTQSLRGKKAKE